MAAPSTMKSALNILCRQCSEFACANIISSTSVGSRPNVPKCLHQIINLIARQRQAPFLHWRAQRRAAVLPQAQLCARRAARPNETDLGLERNPTHADSVMRSCSRVASACSSSAVERRGGLDEKHRAAFHPPDRIQAADMRDVGGLARPGRFGADARRDQNSLPLHRAPPEPRRRAAKPVSQELSESTAELGRGQRSRCRRRSEPAGSSEVTRHPAVSARAAVGRVEIATAPARRTD